ncbi:MAG: pyruvate carboxylase [Cyclobacteriaceae bacterium]|nr:pyruvate carboxylase [Cyclobacteriaceae bacterium]MCH8517401.1 pyruvate carboxylase [Cyclobacteriaceae bacterium]
MTDLSITKLLVANRGEIAIRILRAASELKIRTTAIFTYEDRYSLHRYKADEAYQIGAADDPLKPYLDIEGIISLAKKQGVDAIHPGYGFLSENVTFARRCREEGIVFVGPAPEVMGKLGDKVAAKKIAIEAQVPIIRDCAVDPDELSTAEAEAEKIGYPIMVKAAAGGGGRGMRVVRTSKELKKAVVEAGSEALKAFGDGTVFLEKFIENPKHIEVQLLGDNYGNLVHLFERDCSVQRRFQKVVEIAPSLGLKKETRQKLYDYAIKIGKHVNYNNAGTVEFLVDAQENIYFIEVNPRIQVEHTITEEVTGIDIVRSQILIASGLRLDHKSIYIRSQEELKCKGFAIQCRITTEDPANDFRPDYGTILAYRNAGGFGIRLDEGSCYAGAMISPFFDSMLVKVSSSGRTLKGATERLGRALREFRIRGVKTNIGFLENVIAHPSLYKGEATVGFIGENPDLFRIPKKKDRGTKSLKYLADVAVNGHPDVKFVDPSKKFREPIVPSFDSNAGYPRGYKQLLAQLGPEQFTADILKKKEVLFTDTTFRDAHQSLLATRMRGYDLFKVAEGFAKNHPQVFSMEVWGGATFDVCMRFLHEDPWIRLRHFREAMPNMLLQMLIRGSNAVGYKAYPDNLIERFIEKAAETGIDIFRIFDSLNWVEAMKVSIRAVRERTNAIAQACICYTGDVLTSDKYTLDYYVKLAKELEAEGAHMLAIKDMAGLLKPAAARVLIPALKEAVNIPIHLHTHDTSSIQSTTYQEAINAGVDVVDVAIASMSGLTSQPNFNSLVAMIEGHDRAPKIDLKKLNEYSTYWEDVREYYYPFESGLKAGTAEVYDHEIPGGQYSNLRPQAEALGMGEKFQEVKKNYAIVNRMFGDIIKVTPSSKVVGDMAIFMTSHGLTEEDVMQGDKSLALPESVISLFKGELGQSPGGFPQELSKRVLRNIKPFTDRPNAHLEPIDFEVEMKEFHEEFDEYLTELDFLSYKLYPKVFREFYHFKEEFGEVRHIPTRFFFYPMKNEEEMLVEIDRGKAIIIKKLFQSEPNENGRCMVSFELNGQTRKVYVQDRSFAVDKAVNQKASGELQVGAPLQGRISEIKVQMGQEVAPDDTLFVLEAMKMESTVSADRGGKVKRIVLEAGSMVEQNDLVIELED